MEKKTMHFDDKVNPEAISFPVAVEIEERIIGMLLLFPDLYAKCDALTESDFVTTFSARVFKAVISLYKDNITDLTSLNESFTPEEVSRIYDMRFKRSELTANGVEALNEQISALKREKDKSQAKTKNISSDEELMNLISNARKDKGIN